MRRFYPPHFYLHLIRLFTDFVIPRSTLSALLRTSRTLLPFIILLIRLRLSRRPVIILRAAPMMLPATIPRQKFTRTQIHPH